jgi:16S rRNA G966 N2-methylase RsmD
VFYYFGSKHRLAALYPPPMHDTIIEPFAGSAGYSMRHLRNRAVRRVVLVEKDQRVVDTWQRLLRMTVADLRVLRVPEAGETTDDFLMMTAAASNAIAGCTRMTVTDRQPRAIRMMLRRMEPLLAVAREKVEVVCGDYRDAPDVEATWFVDPPYSPSGRASAGTSRPQGAGYGIGRDAAALDYGELGEWCLARKGQRIVCEQEGATWLPFRHLRGSQDSAGRVAAEVVWADPEHQMSLLG